MKYNELKDSISKNPKRWLVTGAAGFIGSNLVETLLNLGQSVVGLDNFSTGRKINLEDVEASVSSDAWKKFKMIEGDICDLAVCHDAAKNIDYVLHQAALGSVPKSIEDPIKWNKVNIDGFLNMLVASRDAKVSSFVYASSSSVYGDSQELPKVEARVGKPLSPYAVTKQVNELYADVFYKCYGLKNIGLRYFNVFGKRQDPNGAYAAVIPKWISQIVNNEACTINGDGTTSRDFCYIKNVIQANLLAALTDNSKAQNRAYNVGVGDRTDLVTLQKALRSEIERIKGVKAKPPVFGPFRAGDIMHSLANTDAIKSELSFQPTHTFSQGISATVEWYLK